MLIIEKISKTFFPGSVNEKKALQGVSLTLNDGDFATVIGSNGAGKSTLLNAIAGAFQIDQGKIVIDGTDVTRMPEYERAKFIGRVFQDPMKGTAARMMIEENLAMASRRGRRQGLRWSSQAEMTAKFREQLKLLDLGLEDRMTAHVGLLSGGQRQAVTLLMATLVRPQLLLLDEHTAALDPRNAEIVMDLTKEYIKRDNLTAMMVTHNMQFAIDYGNRLIMMDEGHIILDLAGEDKKGLTVQGLVDEFRHIRKKEFDSDEGLLTN